MATRQLVCLASIEFSAIGLKPPARRASGRDAVEIEGAHIARHPKSNPPARRRPVSSSLPDSATQQVGFGVLRVPNSE